MSHFYGSIEDPSRSTLATKRGHKTQGLKAHIRTWNRGVPVEAIHNKRGDEDSFAVTITGGSNNSGRVSDLLFQVTGDEVVLCRGGKRLKRIKI